jgi:hypothetical protein
VPLQIRLRRDGNARGDAQKRKHKRLAQLRERLEHEQRRVLRLDRDIVEIVVREADAAKEERHDARQAGHLGEKVADDQRTDDRCARNESSVNTNRY